MNSPSLSRSFWRSLWQFSRPHTIIGTSLSVWSLAILTATPQELWGEFGGSVLLAWLACVLGNVYIVGLNQLTDVAIDRINKPHLPLAAGDFSPQMGWWIVGIAGMLAALISVLGGQWLGLMVWVSLAIGSVYSLPPLRLKRFPLLAAICIFTVRGVVVNLGLSAHFRQMLALPGLVTSTVWLLTGFIVVFTVAIAIFKDVPDMEGDRQYQIQTFTLLLGKEKILTITLGIIFACYGGMILGGLLLPVTLQPWLFTSSHGILAILLFGYSRRLDLTQKGSITSFYQFIWKLFFLEYIIFPVARLVHLFS